MRQLADLVGISNPYLSQIERGLREPSEKVVAAIADNLEMSAETLKQYRPRPVEGGSEASAVVAAIRADPDLSAKERAALIDAHKSQSFDHEGMLRDPNLAFPLARARELVERGRLGALNHRHLSFMGSITAPGRLMRDHAPEAARRLVEDGVDVALLVPV